MSWKLLKAFPKIMVVAATFVISTGLFGLWWMSRPPPPAPKQQAPAEEPPPKRWADTTRQKKAATLPAKMGWLALVGTDLWDISTGEVIFPSWLNETAPQRLFYQPGTNRLMAQYERMTVRYALDGTRDAELFPGSTPAFSRDGKTAMYVINGDITLADVDWEGFRFTNERQATKLGQFYAPFFAASIMMQSDKHLIVRNQNKHLYVDLKTGEVKPMKQFTANVGRLRSPDGSLVIGGGENGISVVDIDAVTPKQFPTGHGRTVDFQWLNNDMCAVLVNSEYIMAYDRKKESFRDIAKLPYRCSKLVGPSPTGRYVMVMDGKRALVVDFEARKVLEFGILPNNADWISDDSLICCLDVPDTSVRGTWLKKIGQGETRVSIAPYFYGMREKGAETVMPETGLVLFASETTLYRMQKDGSDLHEVGKLLHPVQRIQVVEIWGK